MTKVLISGSRSIKVLPVEAIESINRIIAQNFRIIIGDADGIDSAVQAYLRGQGYRQVTVYYAKFNNLGKPRNHHGFSTVSVMGNYSNRDRMMCSFADYGLAIWDGRSPGTKANIVGVSRGVSHRVPLTRIIKVKG
jgi:adenine-specific DNA-methyltransferase